jgi:hypothetical protein
MIKRKKTDYVQFKIRLRESLRKRLENAAHAKDISLNSEMIARLERSFVHDSLDDQLAVMRKVLKVMDRMAGIIDKRYTKLDQDVALVEEIQKTEDELRKMEDAAWGKQSGFLPAFDVPDKEEIDARLRAVLGRAPTDEELRAAARRVSREQSDEEPELRNLTGSLLKEVDSGKLSIEEAWGRIREARKKTGPRSAQPRLRGRNIEARTPPDQEPELPMPQPRKRHRG